MKRELPRHNEVWRHFKDKLYRIVTIAQHTETGEQMVEKLKECCQWHILLELIKTKWRTIFLRLYKDDSEYKTFGLHFFNVNNK